MSEITAIHHFTSAHKAKLHALTNLRSGDKANDGFVAFAAARAYVKIQTFGIEFENETGETVLNELLQDANNGKDYGKLDDMIRKLNEEEEKSKKDHLLSETLLQ
jgi:hypothetical protein